MAEVDLPGDMSRLAAVAGSRENGSVEGDALRRLDLALEVLGYRRVAAGEGRWRVEAREDGAEVALVDGQFADPVLAEELVAEMAALIEEHGVEAAARMAPHVAPRAWARCQGQAAAPVAGLRAMRPEGAVEAVALRRPYAGFFAVEAHRFRHRRFDGAMSAALERTVLVSGDAATVVPYDPGADRLLLIEQFRPALVARKDPLPWCLEAVAGRCNGGESPEVTVRREAQEEAGLTLGRLERIAGYYSSPGVSAEYITAFVAEASLGAEEGVFGVEHEHEDIRAFVVSRAGAMAALEAGEINNAPLMLSLYWLELNRERLARVWGSLDGSGASG